MKRIGRFIFNLLEVHLPAAVFMLLIASMFTEVFMRYVLNQPSPQLFELSIYCFVWVIYLGGALATRFDQHIRFDLIYRSLSRRARLILEVAFNIFTNTVMLLLVVPGFRYTFQMYPIKASALRVPWTYLLIVYPVFVALVIIHNFMSIYYDLRDLAGRGSRPQEAFPWQ